jgi:radical SAM superfamily enzyme YgiQ (UPF0313 family)
LGASRLRVVLLKPSKYARDGTVERFRRGFMPNATLPHLRSLTPRAVRGRPVEVYAIDEYVRTDLGYLRLLRREEGSATLLALVGVQSHQLHRALDLAALARRQGVEHVVIGGPHPMTCETTDLQGRGASFAVAEAELVWEEILADALAGELRPVYGRERWQRELRSPVLLPPGARELKRHVIPMLGIYPARGCPYRCNFCSVIKIAGRRVRSESVGTTIESLRAARAAGVRLVMFTSDNFNKIPEAEELLRGMIAEKIGLPFFVQCDAQIVRQEALVELLGRAGCWQVFIGLESLDRKTLAEAKKTQNHPERYREIVSLLERHGVCAHFSNIFGFPRDTEASIRDHVRALIDLDPDSASFFVLTPIPGTEQYDDFLARGLIAERNLDRFDTTSLTWRHPSLDGPRLEGLVHAAYRAFYSPRRMISKGREWIRRAGTVPPFGLSFFVQGWLFHWACGVAGTHPMAGGIGRIVRDRAADYAALRRRTFGVDLAPLPASLPLSAGDEAFDRGVALPA